LVKTGKINNRDVYECLSADFAGCMMFQIYRFSDVEIPEYIYDLKDEVFIYDETEALTMMLEWWITDSHMKKEDVLKYLAKRLKDI